MEPKQAATEVSEQGRALWRELWMAKLNVRRAWPRLNEHDRRLLADELRDNLLLELAEYQQAREG